MQIKKLNLKSNLSVLTMLLMSISIFAQKPTVQRKEGSINVKVLAEELVHPWGIEFLPDNRLLVTERTGNLRIYDSVKGLSAPLKGVPEVFDVGQGGLLDVALDPKYDENKLVYLTYAEPGPDSTATTALGRGKFSENGLEGFEVLFRMEPKVEGPNHFGGRILFTEDEKILLTLAERFKFEPAQDLSSHLGTVVRLNMDGSVPNDNPFVGQANALDEIYSYGHRNIESAAIDPKTGNLWVAEMGPMGGDELNLPQPGKNYGWPVVSWGSNYDGTKIPDPTTRPEFADAKIVWTPTISPSGMVFYDGSMFPEWQDNALIGGLTSSGLVIVKINGEQAEEVERIPLAARIRDVELASDGSVYVITDDKNGKILRLTKMKEK